MEFVWFGLGFVAGGVAATVFVRWVLKDGGGIRLPW